MDPFAHKTFVSNHRGKRQINFILIINYVQPKSHLFQIIAKPPQEKLKDNKMCNRRCYGSMHREPWHLENYSCKINLSWCIESKLNFINILSLSRLKSGYESKPLLRLTAQEQCTYVISNMLHSKSTALCFLFVSSH